MTRAVIGLLGLGAIGCSASAAIDQVAPPVAIVDVTLFDGTGAAARSHQTIVVSGDRITAAGPRDAVAVPPGARIVRGAGKYVIPGLSDLHVHLTLIGEDALPLFIANGVTSVRDAGGILSTLQSMRSRIERGELVGPRVSFGGPILDGPAALEHPAEPGEADELTRLMVAIRWAVPDSATGVRVVDSLARMGVDHIKVYSGVDRPAYFAILARARHYGLSVIGHLPDAVTALEAADSGQHSIEHQYGIPIANTGRAAELTRRLAERIRKYRQDPGGRPDPRLALDDTALAMYDPEAARAFAREMAKRQTWLDPTFAVMRVFARVNEDSIASPETLRYLAPSVLRRLPAELPDSGATSATIEAGRIKLERWLDAFRELHRAGVRFTTGTDIGYKGVMPGFSIHQELQLFTRVGFTPAEALLASTRNAAEATGRLDRLGTIEPGKAADLVVLDADPLANIANTRRIAAVIARERLYDRAALDRLLAQVERAAQVKP